MEKDIALHDNDLTAADLQRLRKLMGWHAPSGALVEKAVANSLFTVTACWSGQVIAIGRLVGDGALIWYLQDIIVDPRFHGRGIGRMIIERLLRFVNESIDEGESASVALMAAKGKEGFYEKLGFKQRPDDTHGPGMYMILQKP
ncbi:MAG: GNAT family N-acetyltransferase [Christensenellales bacterium]|jgi:GNAT superfamily N-acetyltransferase